MYLFSPLLALYTPNRDPVVVVPYLPAPQLRLRGLDTERIIFCAFLLERREPRGVPSKCGHSCMVCASVYLTVTPSFSDITDVSIIGHSFKTNRSRTPLFHVAQYGDDIIGRELNLRKLSSELSREIKVFTCFL